MKLVPLVPLRRLFLVGAAVLAATIPVAGQTFLRGDPNHDATVTLSDLTHLLGYMFFGGSPPECLDAADLNDDGRVDVADAALMMQLIFDFESPGWLPAPFPSVGSDPTEDALADCETVPGTGGGFGSEIEHIFFSFATGSTGPAVVQGQEAAVYPMLMETIEDFHGYSIVLQYDNAWVTEATFDFTVGIAADHEADLRVTTIEPIGAEWSMLIGHVLLEALPPYVGETFSAEGRPVVHLGNVAFRVSPEAPLGDVALLRFLPTASLPQIETEVVRLGGQASLPESDDLVLPVLAGAAFVRGDANGDNVVDLGDVLSLLQFLFGDMVLETCEDALDVTDNGGIDVADPIALLQFLFSGAPAPPMPYPLAGTDTTPDDLVDCH